MELYSDAALTNRLSYNDDAGGTQFSKIDYVCSANTPYYIKVRNSSSGVQLHTRLAVKDQMPTASNIMLNSTVHVNVSANWSALYKFTPSTTSTYEIITSSDGTSSDTYLELYTDPGLTYRLAFNDDYNGFYSRIAYTLNAGTNYYIKFNGYWNRAAQAYLKVSNLTTNIPDNVYPLRWPTNSLEVSGWFGKIHEQSNTRFEGIDIQGQSSDSVFSIANGVVASINYDSYYGYNVLV